MSSTPNLVGDGIQAAIERARELSGTSLRRPNVRVMSPRGEEGGLTISARITAQTPQELDAQDGLGVRRVPWGELDARAGELVGLVEAVVLEVETAVASAPRPGPRPSKKIEYDQEAAAVFTSQACKIMTKAVQPLLADQNTKLPFPEMIEALTLGALKIAALAAHTGGLSPGDVREMLREAEADLISRSLDGRRHLQARTFDA